MKDSRFWRLAPKKTLEREINLWEGGILIPQKFQWICLKSEPEVHTCSDEEDEPQEEERMIVWCCSEGALCAERRSLLGEFCRDGGLRRPPLWWEAGVRSSVWFNTCGKVTGGARPPCSVMRPKCLPFSRQTSRTAQKRSEKQTLSFQSLKNTFKTKKTSRWVKHKKIFLYLNILLFEGYYHQIQEQFLEHFIHFYTTNHFNDQFSFSVRIRR